jgi:O-antigen/teichoic acid export membrane protein
MNWYKWDFCLQLVLAAVNGAINIHTNFIGATFRTSNSFEKVGKVQFIIALGYVLLIPMIYYGNIAGYIFYQTILSLLLYLGYWWYRPFKVQYKWNFFNLKEMVKVGFHLYIWNYLSTVSKSFPRLALVIFANPFTVGLYAPAQNVNTAILNLPGLLNRILFPKMSFKYGESGQVHEVIRSSFRWSWMIFGTMSLIALPLSFAIPYVFDHFFPKYAQSSDVAIVALWAGVLYSVNSIFQLTITSIKAHSELHQLIIMRFVFLGLGIGLSYMMTWNWLMIVSVSAMMAEILNIFHGILILRKKLNS